MIDNELRSPDRGNQEVPGVSDASLLICRDLTMESMSPQRQDINQQGSPSSDGFHTSISIMSDQQGSQGSHISISPQVPDLRLAKITEFPCILCFHGYKCGYKEMSTRGFVSVDSGCRVSRGQ